MRFFYCVLLMNSADKYINSHFLKDFHLLSNYYLGKAFELHAV